MSALDVPLVVLAWMGVLFAAILGLAFLAWLVGKLGDEQGPSPFDPPMFTVTTIRSRPAPTTETEEQK